jgi:outer membrane protein assembly factor BamD
MLGLASCSEYTEAIKSTDPDYKMEIAKELYEAQDYLRAFTLFEELLNMYRGTSKAEEIYYYYAYCYYGQRNYLLAAYHFKNYSRTFPASEKATECAFMGAKCYYYDSPIYSLDQSSTHKAINELQLFIDQNPGSEHLDECTALIEDLRAKLEVKHYEIVKQYYKIGEFRATIVTCRNFLDEYPDTEYREEALFLQLRAHYDLAVNSVQERKEERLYETISAYKDFARQFPESRSLKPAEAIYNKALNDIEGI